MYVHAMEVQSGLADFKVSAQTMSVKRCMLLPTLIPTLPGKVFFPRPFLARLDRSGVQTRLSTTIPPPLPVYLMSLHVIKPARPSLSILAYTGSHKIKETGKAWE